MKLKQLVMVLLSASLVFLAGCASKSFDMQDLHKMSNAELRELGNNMEKKRIERAPLVEKIMQEVLLSDQKLKPADGVTMQCVSFPMSDYKELVLYRGDNAPSLDRNAWNGMTIMAAESDCRPQTILAEGGVTMPVILVNEAGMSKGFLKTAAEQWGLVFNGAGSLLVDKLIGNDNCHPNCGPGMTINNMGGTSMSQSMTELLGLTEITFGACPNGQCENVFSAPPTPTDDNGHGGT